MRRSGTDNQAWPMSSAANQLEHQMWPNAFGCRAPVVFTVTQMMTTPQGYAQIATFERISQSRSASFTKPMNPLLRNRALEVNVWNCILAPETRPSAFGQKLAYSEAANAPMYIIQSCDRLSRKRSSVQLSRAWLDPALLIWVTNAGWRRLTHNSH